MNRTERFYLINQMLHEHGAVPLNDILARLEISRATFKRDLEYMRSRMHAPIIWNREAAGYCFDKSDPAALRYALPGLWFSASELFALLASQKLLADIEPGVLAAHVAPLQSQLTRLLAAAGHTADEVSRRVRLLSIARRKVEPRFFTEIALAVMSRRQLRVEHWNRERDELSTRTLSPQRLVHYRDNWYLDAWCHLRKDLRSFAAETLKQVEVLSDSARDVAEQTLDAHYTSAYGIFAGAPTATASLLFSAERARWVRHESWHPEQHGEDLPDGRYRLCVPYSDERELLMDILRHGAHVTVEAPADLRHRIANEVVRMHEEYGKNYSGT